MLRCLAPTRRTGPRRPRRWRWCALPGDDACRRPWPPGRRRRRGGRQRRRRGAAAAADRPGPAGGRRSCAAPRHLRLHDRSTSCGPPRWNPGRADRPSHRSLLRQVGTTTGRASAFGFEEDAGPAPRAEQARSGPGSAGFPAGRSAGPPAVLASGEQAEPFIPEARPPGSSSRVGATRSGTRGRPGSALRPSGWPRQADHLSERSPAQARRRRPGRSHRTGRTGRTGSRCSPQLGWTGPPFARQRRLEVAGASRRPGGLGGAFPGAAGFDPGGGSGSDHGQVVGFRLISPWTRPEGAVEASGSSQDPGRARFRLPGGPARRRRGAGGRASSRGTGGPGRGGPTGGGVCRTVGWSHADGESTLAGYQTGASSGCFTGRRGVLLHQDVTLGLAYLGLEPFVRRRWPGRLVGWARLLAGRWQDPRVGRDVLIGAATGAVWAAQT